MVNTDLAPLNIPKADAVMCAGNKIWLVTPCSQENAVASQLDLPLPVDDLCYVHRWRSYMRPLRAWSLEMHLHTWLQRQAAHPRPLCPQLVSHLQGLFHILGLCCQVTLWQLELVLSCSVRCKD